MLHIIQFKLSKTATLREIYNCHYWEIVLLGNNQKQAYYYWFLNVGIGKDVCIILTLNWVIEKIWYDESFIYNIIYFIDLLKWHNVTIECKEKDYLHYVWKVWRKKTHKHFIKRLHPARWASWSNCLVQVTESEWTWFLIIQDIYLV